MKPQFTKTVCSILLGLLTSITFSQNENNKWCFGSSAGLDFNSNPPSSISTSTMNAIYSCASIADASGNLLFYTNGITVWTSTNSIMANGTGLNGSMTGNQTVIIVKKPASSTNYYIFTIAYNASGTSGLFESEVDMSLASGSGSVVGKNTPIYTLTAITSTTIPGKITATKHCNGSDIWLVLRDWTPYISAGTGTVSTNNSFRAFPISSTGIGTTAVVSSPIVYTGSLTSVSDYGSIKISPNGRKLAASNYYGLTNNMFGAFELFDFDNSTGVVSNSLALVPVNTTYNSSWGIEFSPDGSKLYGSKLSGVSSGGIFQWDLCAGSPTAIIASMYTVAALSSTQIIGTLQRGPDNKIYCSRWGETSLDVIHTPNSIGSACAYTASAQSLGTGTLTYALPNFMNSYTPQHPATVPFTITPTSCQTASFNSIYTPGSFYGCDASGYSVTSVQWTFGDPSSGASNTSTLLNPSHYYTALGNYTTQLVVYYSCGGGTDTLRQIANISAPCLSVSSTSISCAIPGDATLTASGAGPFSYTWMPGAFTGSVANNVFPGNYTITVFDLGNNSVFTSVITLTTSNPLTANVLRSSSVSCNAASTATAMVTGISGGSGSHHYLWTNGSTSFSTSMVTGLGAGTWSFTLSDDLSACSVNSVFVITQPTAMSLTINSPTTCGTSSVVLTGTTSGGTGSAYTYSWNGTAGNQSLSVSPTSPGIYIYTLTARDVNSCAISATTNAEFIPNPTLSISSVSICTFEVATLTVSGASSYTWSAGTSTLSTGSSFTDSPQSTSTYTIKGSALGCTAAATASIVLKPSPILTLSANNPVCEGQTLQLQGSGGAGFTWSGPQSFGSSLANPSFVVVSVSEAGVYNVTVTAANNCTALASINISVNPQPTLFISGSQTLCAGGTTTLMAMGATNYSLSGIASGSAIIISPAVNTQYTVTGSSNNNCSNSSIISVTVMPLPVLSVAGNTSVCQGTSITQTIGGALSYSWSNGAQTATASLAPMVNTVYVITGTDANGCHSSTSSSVTVNALPTLSISNSASTICAGGTVSLSVNGGVSWLWDTGDITSDIVVNPTITTTYSVSGTGANGCSSSTTQVLTVYNCTGINIQNPEANTITIWPNPGKGLFNITHNQNHNVRVDVYSTLGILIQEKQVQGKNDLLDLSDAANGVYFLLIRTEGTQQVIKIIKE